jgi:formylglycine-generating enzyme required for sulfatase activity
LVIASAVPQKKRTPQQQQLMRLTARRYGLFAVVTIVLVSLVSGTLWHVVGVREAERIVNAIRTAEFSKLQSLIDNDLPRYRRWADRQLASIANSNSADPETRLKASLAMVPVDARQVTYLSQRLLDCSPDALSLILPSLLPHRKQLTDRLWETFRDPQEDSRDRFRAGLALAQFAPGAEQWNDADASYLSEQLIRAHPDHQQQLRSYLVRISDRLLPPLQALSRQATPDALRSAAAVALVEFDGDNPERMAQLISSATVARYDFLYRALFEERPREATGPLRDRLRSLIISSSDDPPSEEGQVRFGRQQAVAAITLMRQGEREAVFGLFDWQRPDALSQFVHWHKDHGLTPDTLIDCLHRAVATGDECARFGLLLAVREHTWQDIPPHHREPLRRKLVEWYAHDPSSAIHGATGLLLRHWGFTDEASQVDHTPVSYDASGDRKWFVHRIVESQENSACLTFVVIPPGTYQMGSPASEAGHVTGEAEDEKLHQVSISRAFAVTDREITRSQWRSGIGTSGDEAARSISWYEAIQYCRMLTVQAGMSEGDQCYPDPRESAAGGNLSFHPERRGFRLLTEAEWEYACRAGTRTPYSFGSDRDLAGAYGWFEGNSSSKAQRVGYLKPNLRGLFDMHGNMLEWCHDLFQQHLPPTQDPIGPPTGEKRILRGGAINQNVKDLRSAVRYRASPTDRFNFMGIRVARTLP